jgi:hypothetical protein
VVPIPTLEANVDATVVEVAVSEPTVKFPTVEEDVMEPP